MKTFIKNHDIKKSVFLGNIIHNIDDKTTLVIKDITDFSTIHSLYSRTIRKK